MNRNRLVILAGIVLLAGMLVFSWAAQQPGTAGGCCGAAVSASPAPAAGADTPGAMFCGTSSFCPMTQGAGKEICDAYMNETAGLRKDLAEARAELNSILLSRPIDKEAVSKQVQKVNSLQSELYIETIAMWVAVNEQLPAGKACENCKGPVAHCMMMSDQCPKMIGMGCCGADNMGCSKAPAKPAADNALKCGSAGCAITQGDKTSK